MLSASACFSPVNNVALPSLYWPVTRRGPDDDFVFDESFERIWRWKDELPRRRWAIYAKYFRTRGTFISLEYLPYFLAMRASAVSPTDHARWYAEGRIRDDARVIWEALAEHGPLATVELRHLCHMETKAGNVRFKRAVLDLQSLLLVTHFGKEQEIGAWESTRFELICRAFPRADGSREPHRSGCRPRETRREVSAVAIRRPSGTIVATVRLVERRNGGRHQRCRSRQGRSERQKARMKIILASASPRRAEILRNAAIPFETMAEVIDESRRPGELRADYVRRLALTKARAAAGVAHPPADCLFIGADTVVEVGDAILGKPESPDDAPRMLRLLSGTTHEVHTGLAIIRRPGAAEAVVEEATRVTFAPLSDRRNRGVHRHGRAFR